MYYHFFLNGPVDRASIHAMYEEIQTRCPFIDLSHPIEEMVSYTLDKERGPWEAGDEPGLEFRKYMDLDIVYCGDVDDGTPYAPEESYFLRHGRRQLHMEFVSWQGIGHRMLREPEHGLELLDLMAIVARQVDPIVGTFLTEAVFDMVEWPAFSAMEFLKSVLEAQPWGSLYLDVELANDVGVDWLREWADVLIQVNGLGYLVEAGGYLGPEIPDPRDEDCLTYRGYWIVQEHIVERLVKEYGYRKDSIGRYV